MDIGHMLILFITIHYFQIWAIQQQHDPPSTIQTPHQNSVFSSWNYQMHIDFLYTYVIQFFLITILNILDASFRYENWIKLVNEFWHFFVKVFYAWFLFHQFENFCLKSLFVLCVAFFCCTLWAQSVLIWSRVYAQKKHNDVYCKFNYDDHHELYFCFDFLRYQLS